MLTQHYSFLVQQIIFETCALAISHGINYRGTSRTIFSSLDLAAYGLGFGHAGCGLRSGCTNLS